VQFVEHIERARGRGSGAGLIADASEFIQSVSNHDASGRAAASQAATA
jgi:hypothetical protein